MSNPTNSLRSRLSLESLEDRLTPASPLVIQGTLGNDVVTVSQQTINGFAGPVQLLRVTQNGVTRSYLASGVSAIHFYGSAGNDYFRNDTSVRTVAYGQAGNDILVGGWGNDYLDGGSGNDSLYGRNGNDVMVGGSGWDHANGGFGWDFAFGCESKVMVP